MRCWPMSPESSEARDVCYSRGGGRRAILRDVRLAPGTTPALTTRLRPRAPRTGWGKAQTNRNDRPDWRLFSLRLRGVRLRTSTLTGLVQCRRQGIGELAMNTFKSTQVFSIFGGGYVAESHGQDALFLQKAK